MRSKHRNGDLINREILREDPFPLALSKKHVGYCRSFVDRLTRLGKKSPVTGKVVRLEFVYLAPKTRATSVAAFRRFEERLNGADIPLPKQ